MIGSYRHTPSTPCPVCKGHVNLRRGRGIRCWGYTSGDYAVCTREEQGGRAKEGGGYLHYLVLGSCECGQNHLV